MAVLRIRQIFGGEMRRLLLVVALVTLISGVTSVSVLLAGTWEGTGTGNCPNPTSNPVETMRPWHEWNGEIPEDETTFSGQWCDPAGVHGTFQGSNTSSQSENIYLGTWNAVDDEVFPPVVYEMGTFEMEFSGDECRGHWWTYDSDMFRGTMEGRRVD